MLGARTRLAPVSRIEGGLAAASLIFGELDVAANSPQHLNGVDRDLGQQLVHKARHK
jgi:hypothetical protein